MTYRTDSFDQHGTPGSRPFHVPFAEVFGPVSFVADGVIAAFHETASILRAVAEGVSRRRRVHSTVHALASLDDHTLKDIGLNRSSILSTAHMIEVERRRVLW
ncbi:MAG: DUF1127 domain-containing protein [Alphaproteobacteria bacterium]|nr:DUF1127 domain-containing protein [Alphaproteobacteria bacterium]